MVTKQAGQTHRIVVLYSDEHNVLVYLTFFDVIPNNKFEIGKPRSLQGTELRLHASLLDGRSRPKNTRPVIVIGSGVARNLPIEFFN
jgi:hypothetical protein